MKMVGKISVVAFLSVVLATPAMAAPSAKFAAHVHDKDGVYLLQTGMVEGVKVPAGTKGVPTIDEADILEATLKTANKKDLLIGVSLQSGIYTDTTVKGKNGSAETAGAEGAIEVEVVIDGHPVYPKSVVFAKRVQELTAKMGGVIESCPVNCSVDVSDPLDPTVTCDEIDVANDCVVTDEEIGLMLNTTSANHFNFVAKDLDAGSHTVTVKAKAIASAQFTNGTWETTDENGNIVVNETTDNVAKSSALVKLGSLTVEEVRATNTEDGITLTIDMDAQ